MSITKRIIIACIIALLSGFVCYVYHTVFYPVPAGDFSWPLIASRLMLRGETPYNPSAYPYGTPFYYPMTAAFAALPFAPFDNLLAGAMFFGLSSGLLAYVISRDCAWWRLLIFVSAPYYEALRTVQWSPLFALMLFVAPLLPFVLIKPNVGLPLVMIDRRHWTRSSVALTVGVGLVSLLVLPPWPLQWMSGLGPYTDFVPLLIMPLGPLLALSLLRWRDRDARLLLLMALFPRRVWYDQLPLLFVSHDWKELLLLSLTSWMGYVGWKTLATYEAWPLWMLCSVYLPALVLVLHHGYQTIRLKKSTMA